MATYHVQGNIPNDELNAEILKTAQELTLSIKGLEKVKAMLSTIPDIPDHLNKDAAILPDRYASLVVLAITLLKEADLEDERLDLLKEVSGYPNVPMTLQELDDLEHR